MDKTVPLGAGLLLDFIGETEAPRGYDTVYGNNQAKLPKPVTRMTVDEVLAAQPGWSKRFGSSATGRYQFMNKTLGELKRELGLRGSQLFDGDLQDRLAFHLLKRRGYQDYAAGRLSVVDFGKKLAQEWASFPVLADTEGAHRRVTRGQSYYAGDGVNKSLVKPEKVESVLSAMLVLEDAHAVPAPPIEPGISASPPDTEPATDVVTPGLRSGNFGFMAALGLVVLILIAIAFIFTR